MKQTFMDGIKQIIGKKAYWGRFTFEATRDTVDRNQIRIDVYSNTPRMHEVPFYVQTKEQILAMSQDQTSPLRFYTGNLGFLHHKKITKLTPRSKKECQDTILVPAIDTFLEAFKYDI